MFQGMNFSMLPTVDPNLLSSVVANPAANVMTPNPAAASPSVMTPNPMATPQKPWYENPGFWSMIGKFGAAISPKDSLGRDLGLAAAAEGQARQYGKGMNKMIGPMLAGETPTQLGSVAPTPAPSISGGSSAIPPTPGVAPGTYPGVGPAVNPVQPVNPFNDVPFSGGPSTPVLSNMEMMGLSPDQIKDVFGAAVEAKKFPMEIDRLRTGTEYTKELTRHTKAATDEAAKQAKIKEGLDASWNSFLDDAMNPESATKLPKYIDPSAVPLLKGLGREKAATIIDNLINLQKESKKSYQIHYDNKTGKAYGVNTQNLADRFEWDIAKDDGAEKNPSGAYINFAYNRSLSNSLPALEEHYVKTLGDKAKARQKMVQIQAMLGKDPNLAAGEIQALLATAPTAIRDKIMADYNATLTSMVANKGQIIPGGEPAQGSQTQGTNAGPGILMNRQPVPPKNKFMIDGFGDKTSLRNSVLQQANEAGVPAPLVDAIVTAESNWEHFTPDKKVKKNPKSSAKGLFQLTDATAQTYGVDSNDIDQNVKGGLTHLKKSLEKANGDIFKTALYYYEGVNKDLTKASPEGLKYADKISKLYNKESVKPKTASLSVPAGTIGKTKDGKTVRMMPDGSIQYVN